jgi:hypothetical protein
MNRLILTLLSGLLITALGFAIGWYLDEHMHVLLVPHAFLGGYVTAMVTSFVWVWQS